MSKKLTNEEFLERLLKQNKHYRNGDFWARGDYINMITRVLCENRFGLLKILPTDLLRGVNPTIRVAVDKRSYYINQVREVHGDKYDYSLVVYIDTASEIEIICPIHGSFWQLAANHLKGCGCPDCSNAIISFKNRNACGWGWRKWKKRGLKSKNFDSFKCYIVKIYNGEETFYKIGKTFQKVKDRFSCQKCKCMPYQYKVIKTFIGTAKQIHDLERDIKRLNKECKYLPNKKFHGKYECFSKIDWEKVNKLVKKGNFTVK